jgi:CheY-like chemotaxis protein
MPVMTGLEAAPLLREMLPDVRLILFTVSEGPEVDRLARGAGIHAVVSKSRGAFKLILKAQGLLRSIEQEYSPANLGTRQERVP